MEASCYYIFVVLLINGVSAYPQGPPVGQNDGATLCDDMAPVHGFNPQTSDAPYQIKTSTDCYNAGATISVRVTLNDMATKDNYFEGFLLMARRDDGSTTSIGTFDVMEQEHMSTLDCHGNSMSAMGHTAAFHFLVRTFQWTAPAADEGDLLFIATVVHETEEFWVNVTSGVLNFDPSCTVTTELAAETYPDIEGTADQCDLDASHRTEGVECDAAALQPIIALLAIILVMRALIA